MATSKTTKAVRADLGPKALYEVLSNLSHDNEAYAPGDQVELTEAQAAQLPGVVKPAAAEASK